ncbi:MAG: sigma-54 dependent transcriptional regulator [Thermodesulfobacteriota bacterium]
MNKKRLLVVDDESAHRLMLRAHLEAAGFEVDQAATGHEALAAIEAVPPDLMLLDLRMPDLDGLEVLSRLVASGRDLPVIIMTAYSSIDSALKAGQLGIRHYLTKPLDTDELLLKIEEVLKLKDIARIQARQEEELGRKYDFSELLGRSPVMLKMKEMLALVAPSEATVLITGESGTGKELVARALHKNSPRRNKGFLPVNCAALAETLLESELFGHEKGAFTGAVQRKAGRFELADGGTLLLDEIGEMALTTQAKLLRVLEERSFERVGGTKPIQVDVRVLAATNRDIEVEIGSGRFREDLYYRLNVVQIHVPALRERGPEDIREIADYVLAQSSARNRKSIKSFTPKALKALATYPWPGNVRELVNAVERAVILVRGEEVDLDELPHSIQSWSSGRRRDNSGASLSPGLTLREVEAELIQRTLAETEGNRTKAAAMLGITRQTLLNKIKEYGLE